MCVRVDTPSMQGRCHAYMYVLARYVFLQTLAQSPLSEGRPGEREEAWADDRPFPA